MRHALAATLSALFVAIVFMAATSGPAAASGDSEAVAHCFFSFSGGCTF